METGIISSAGKNTVKVYRRPRILLISTGDEVVAPGQELQKGKIYNSNLYTLHAQLKMWNADVTETLHSGDDADHLAEIINSRIDDVDMVITSGGVSVGKKDILHDVYSILGVDTLVRNVRMKPGMAMLAGTYKGKMVLSLSGNPYAAYTGLHMIGRPVIEAMAGCKRPSIQRMKAVLMNDYTKASPTRRFVRARVVDGEAYIEGHTGGNGDIYSGHETTALVEIPAGSGPLKAGTTVTVIMV